MVYGVLSGVMLAFMIFNHLEAGKTKSDSQYPLGDSRVKTSIFERSLSEGGESKAWSENQKLARQHSLHNLKKPAIDYHQLVKEGEDARKHAKVVSKCLEFSKTIEIQRHKELECSDALKKIIELQEKKNVVALHALMPSREIIYFKSILFIRSRKLSQASLWLNSIRHIDDKAQFLFAILVSHIGGPDYASNIFGELMCSIEKRDNYYLNLANIYEMQDKYPDAKRTYQLAFNSEIKQSVAPSLSKLLLLTCGENNDLENLRHLLKQGEEIFISENKGSSEIDLAYLAYYLGKREEAEELCHQAHKITSKERYEPRSLQGLSEDILISTLYWSLGQNLGKPSEIDQKSKALVRMGEVTKSLNHKPFDSNNVRLILYYLEPRKVSEFMDSGREEENLNKLSQELLGQRNIISNVIAQAKQPESL